MHVLEAQQFERDWLEHELFPLADQLAATTGPDRATPLRGRRLFWLFFETSTRTRVSFESAVALLGGSASGLDVSTHQEELVSERLEDRIRVLNDYEYDYILLRYHQEGGARRAAAVSTAPIITAGDGPGQHPTQALLDVYTLRRELGRVDGLRLALVGDLTFERTTNSLAFLLARFEDIQLDLVSPESLRIRSDVRSYLDAHHVRYRELDDLRAVASEVDAIYLTRAHSGRIQHALRFSPNAGVYAVTQEILDLMRPHAVVLHPLPRGEELPPELDDDPRVACFRQARNGLAIRMALLSLLTPGPTSSQGAATA
jgi:aspartate carbamoyltransferase catalytic subunit